MLSSPVIDLAIGLTFVFGVTAALASLVTEMVARLMGLRGAYLLSGLRELVDSGLSSTDLTKVTADYKAMQGLITQGKPAAAQPAAAQPAAQPAAEGQTPAAAQPAAAEGQAPAEGQQTAPPSVTAALLGGPILGNQGLVGQLSSRQLKLGQTTKTGRLPEITPASGSGPKWRQLTGKWGQLRSLPSYISSKSFADAVVDLVVPDAKGQTSMSVIQANIKELPDPFKGSLQALAKNAGDDVGEFRTSVEQWYDDHMDRVSGWYKRRVAKITLAFGALIVVLLNLNAVTIGRTLYTENAVSAAISTVAGKASCTGDSQQNCLNGLEGQISAAAAAGLPVGWGTVRDCTEPTARCGWFEQRGLWSRHGGSGWQVVLVLIGFLIMVISILPGAQFWFGLLSKLGTLRSTGPKPAAGQLSEQLFSTNILD